MRRRGNAAHRRDSTLIAIVEEDLLRQMHGLIMLPTQISSAGTGTGREAGRGRGGKAKVAATSLHPKETTMSFVSVVGGVRESTLSFDLSGDKEEDDDDDYSQKEEEEGEEEEEGTLYGVKKNGKSKRKRGGSRRRRRRSVNNKVRPIPPATTIQVKGNKSASSQFPTVKITVTPPSPRAKKDSRSPKAICKRKSNGSSSSGSCEQKMHFLTPDYTG